MANTEKKKEAFKAVTLRSKSDQLSFMKKKLPEHLEKYKQCSAQVSDRCKKHSGMSLRENYYHSYHDEFDGKFPICKDCLQELTSNEVGELSRKGLALICPVLNIPFLQDQYESALKSKGTSLGLYLKNILLNYRDLRFVDSDSDIVHFQEEVDNGYDVSKIVVDDELFQKWGAYHPKEDIIELENNFKRYLNTYNVEGMIEEKLVKKACIYELQENKLLAQGKSTKEISKLWSDTIGLLELKPSQQGSDANKIKDVGMIIKKLEETAPVWDEDEQLSDVDGMMKYVDRFLTHITKNFGKYNPKDGD